MVGLDLCEGVGGNCAYGFTVNENVFDDITCIGSDLRNNSVVDSHIGLANRDGTVCSIFNIDVEHEVIHMELSHFDHDELIGCAALQFSGFACFNGNFLAVYAENDIGCTFVYKNNITVINIDGRVVCGSDVLAVGFDGNISGYGYISGDFGIKLEFDYRAVSCVGECVFNSSVAFTGGGVDCFTGEDFDSNSCSLFVPGYGNGYSFSNCCVIESENFGVYGVVGDFCAASVIVVCTNGCSNECFAVNIGLFAVFDLDFLQLLCNYGDRNFRGFSAISYGYRSIEYENCGAVSNTGSITRDCYSIAVIVSNLKSQTRGIQFHTFNLFCVKGFIGYNNDAGNCNCFNFELDFLVVNSLFYTISSMSIRIFYNKSACNEISIFIKADGIANSISSYIFQITVIEFCSDFYRILIKELFCKALTSNVLFSLIVTGYFNRDGIYLLLSYGDIKGLYKSITLEGLITGSNSYSPCAGLQFTVIKCVTVKNNSYILIIVYRRTVVINCLYSNFGVECIAFEIFGLLGSNFDGCDLGFSYGNFSGNRSYFITKVLSSLSII